MDAIALAGVYSCPPGHKPSYAEHLCVPSLSVGTYSIPAGGLDDQVPHAEDEVYLVTGGRGWFTGGANGKIPVGPGSVLYVPAGEDHRFVDVEEDLAMVVVFAPPYGSTDQG